MFDLLILIVSWALILVGCVFVISGAVGMLRMPDLYTRLHAASVTDTGGIMLISMALILQAGFVYGSSIVVLKVLLILFFTLFTAPTASHALAKTALLSGQVPVDVDGNPILESPEEAMLLARSRAPEYRSGQDSEEYLQELKRAEHVADQARNKAQGAQD